MLTISSWTVLVAAALIVFVVGKPVAKLPQERESHVGRCVCAAACLMGCALRLAALSTLPSGLSADEALVGVQGKALWQTGRFYPDGLLTPMLPQWKGAYTGPLLSVITAPFVGLLGLSAFSVRLPLVLLSMAAMPAVYVLGCELSDRKAGRFLAVVYALCPYFVLGARMTCAGNAAIFLLPVATAFLAVGIKKPAYLYLGMIVLALSAYTQRMMLMIAPLTVMGAAIVGLLYGKSKKHALISAILGLMMSVPAILTAYVNLIELEGFTLLNSLEIPQYRLFADHLLARIQWDDGICDVLYTILAKLWCTVIGGVFQAVWTENIDPALFMPSGLLALTVVSVPLIVMGAGTLMMRCIDRKKYEKEKKPVRVLVTVMFIIAYACVAIFGSEGCYAIGGAPDVFDHAHLFFFTALLMTAGWRQIQRRNRIAEHMLAGLLIICFAGMGVHLFGGNYQMNANVYFDDFADACVYAKEIQDETGRKIYVTSKVHPNVDPYAAARMMYLYAVDADLNREQNMEVMYAPDIDQADENRIYVVESNEVAHWDWGTMRYEGFGNYAVIAR